MLVRAISTAATCVDPPEYQLPSNPEQCAKLILAIGRSGARVVMCDNLIDPVGCGPLASAITSAKLRERPVHSADTTTVPMRCCWFFTGNNLRWKDDMARRVMLVHLSGQENRAAAPRMFRYPRLLDHLHRTHRDVIVDVLTAFRAFHVAGRPSTGLALYESFEEWDAVVRAMLMWAGWQDPCRGRAANVAEADVDLAVLRQVCGALMLTCGSRPSTVGQLIASATSSDVLREALQALDVEGRGVNSRSIGNTMARLEGRRVLLDGAQRWLERAGHRHGAVLWLVRSEWEGSSGSQGSFNTVIPGLEGEHSRRLEDHLQNSPNSHVLGGPAGGCAGSSVVGEGTSPIDNVVVSGEDGGQ